MLPICRSSGCASKLLSRKVQVALWHIQRHNATHSKSPQTDWNEGREEKEQSEPRGQQGPLKPVQCGLCAKRARVRGERGGEIGGARRVQMAKRVG